VLNYEARNRFVAATRRAGSIRSVRVSAPRFDAMNRRSKNAPTANAIFQRHDIVCSFNNTMRAQQVMTLKPR
jgi:hypothetical protein